MFRRRKPLPLPQRILDFLWPRGGWRRSSAYFAHRVRRLPGTPYRVAAGFACGAAISFTPLIGFHLIGAVLLAVILRGNLAASLIGTLVGNPWTFPFIWLWTYKIGHLALGGNAVAAAPSEPRFVNVFSSLMRALLEFDLAYIIGHVWPVLLPMTIGGVPTAVVAWFAFFLPIRRTVSEYQRARHRRMRRKVKRRRERIRSAAMPELEKDEV